MTARASRVWGWARRHRSAAVALGVIVAAIALFLSWTMLRFGLLLFRAVEARVMPDIRHDPLAAVGGLAWLLAAAVVGYGEWRERSALNGEWVLLSGIMTDRAVAMRLCDHLARTLIGAALGKLRQDEETIVFTVERNRCRLMVEVWSDDGSVNVSLDTASISPAARQTFDEAHRAISKMIDAIEAQSD